MGDSSSERKKKGNWITIGYTPANYEIYPCEHVWRAKHPNPPCPKYKQRWMVVPLSDRIKQMALPLLRRLLALWLEFGDKFPPEMRRRLLAFLVNAYGLTEEFLERILEEARKAEEEELKGKEKKGKRRKGGKKSKGKSEKEKEGKTEKEKEGKSEKEKEGKTEKEKEGKTEKEKEGKTEKEKEGKAEKEKEGKAEEGKKGKAEEGKKGKAEKGKKRKAGKAEKGKKRKAGKAEKGKKRKAGKAEKEKKGKGKKGKGEKGKERKEKEESDALPFKRRKAGKLPLDWPYNMGSKFVLKCIAFLSKDPDEDYNSRAAEYFDVQATAILEVVCQYLDMPLPDPDKPTHYGETLAIMALNLSDWIAKYVVTPAAAIPDNMVQELLALRGVRPKPKPPPKKPKPPPPPRKDKKGRKKKVPEPEPEPEPITEVQRVWDQMKSPVYVPEKTKVAKRMPLEGEGDDQVEDTGYQSESEKVAEPEKLTEPESEQESAAGWRVSTLEDIKKEFLEYINWYNPLEPEFMYLGPKKTPNGINMFKLWDPDTEEVPADLRALNWNWEEQGFADNYSFVPAPVPQYYPALRPLRPVRLEDLERSGTPKEIIEQNLRFFSPWYLIKKPLEPPPSSPPEEVSEDAMLKTEIKDSLWGDNKMKEQIEMLGHLLHLMSFVPDLAIEHVFELLEEFVKMVSCAQADENPSEENKLLNAKRSIVLERYFLDFFGPKFRDFDSKTHSYVKALCERCAYYIQLLYQHTAKSLWEIQSTHDPPTPTTPTPTDDEDALRGWDDWLAWLLAVAETCDEWAGWITETVGEAERKGERFGPDGQKVGPKRGELFKWKEEIKNKVCEYGNVKRRIYGDSRYYLEKAKNLLRVKHRSVKKTPEAEIDAEREVFEGEM